MGGPSYQTPYPVDAGKGDGSQVIWDWGTKSWNPYDPAAAKARAADIAVTPTDRTGRDVGLGGNTAEAPDRSAPSSDAPAPDKGRDHGIGVGQLPRPRLLRTQTARNAAQRGVPGASLLNDMRERGYG